MNISPNNIIPGSVEKALKQCPFSISKILYSPAHCRQSSSCYQKKPRSKTLEGVVAHLSGISNYCSVSIKMSPHKITPLLTFNTIIISEKHHCGEQWCF